MFESRAKSNGVIVQLGFDAHEHDGLVYQILSGGDIANQFAHSAREGGPIRRNEHFAFVRWLAGVATLTVTFRPGTNGGTRAVS